MVKRSKGQVKELYESFALYYRKFSKLFLLNPLTTLCIYICTIWKSLQLAMLTFHHPQIHVFQKVKDDCSKWMKVSSIDRLMWHLVAHLCFDLVAWGGGLWPHLHPPPPQGPRKPTSLKYHIELAVVPWKHKIIKSVHIYMHNELKAFFCTVHIYMHNVLQVIWNKMVKRSKGYYNFFSTYELTLYKFFAHSKNPSFLE